LNYADLEMPVWSVGVRAGRVRTRPRRLLVALTLFGLVAQAGVSLAQSPHAPGSGINDVPSGQASILGRMVHPEGGARTEGSTIVLYSLAADGSPGVRTTTTDARGQFFFENISGAPGITYLIGASYASIPYGQRVRFEAGQEEMVIEIEVDEPSGDVTAISVGESSQRLEWIGSNLAVEEVHHLLNSSDKTIVVPKEDREGTSAPFSAKLPPDATRLDTSLSGAGDGFEERGELLLFWGPIFADGQDLKFRYLIPLPDFASGDASLSWALPSGSQRASLVFPTSGLRLSGEGLDPGPDVISGGRDYLSLDAGKITPGDRVRFSVTMPEMVNDAAAITLSRADYWLEMDDTFLQVRAQITIEVAEGAHLAGSLDEPLLRFDIPPGAEFQGVSVESQSLGIAPMSEGSIDLVGPISPGEDSLGFQYRIPVAGKEPEFTLRFPKRVDHLNVLVADTGIVIETDRLHRRRPFRQGTRVYMHREAYQIDAMEAVSIGLQPIHRSGFGRNTNLIAVSTLAAAGIWFLLAPLGGGPRATPKHSEVARIRSERELVYGSIRDLEHDYEIGLTSQSEYQAMRGELRSRALELLRQERDADGKAATDGAATAAAPATAPSFCTGCGAALDGDWRFCAKCGTPAASA